MNSTLNHIKDFHQWSRLPNSYYDIGIFANVVPYNDGYIGAVRLGNASANDQVGIVNYDNDLNLLNCTQITAGEDPRTFIFNNIPYALTWYGYYASGQWVMRYKLINLQTRAVLNLIIEDVPLSPLSVLGKNWMPLVKNGALYIVVSIDPDINVLYCDTTTGYCIWITSNFTGNIPVTLNRGGTPFIWHNKLQKYIGLGHKSYDSSNHRPFPYTITKDFTKVYIGEDVITGNFGVEDPQSIFMQDNKLYCCIGNWHVPNEGSVGLYEIIID